MSFLDKMFAGAASALRTLTGYVDVSQSPDPNVGDTLVVVQKGKAIWQAGGGGGGSGVPKLASRVVIVDVEDPADEALGVIDAVPGSQYFVYVDDVPPGSDLPRVRLPSARDPAVTGQTILVTFYSWMAGNAFELATPVGDLGGDYMIFDGMLYPYPAVKGLEPGTYECRALFDPASGFGDAYGFWVITRSPDVLQRRDQDVDYAMPGYIPDDATVSEDSLTGMPSYEGTFTPLPFDGDTNNGGHYRVGDLILVYTTHDPPQLRDAKRQIFPPTKAPRAAAAYPGVYEVLRWEHSIDWKIRLVQIYEFVIMQSGTKTEPTYRVRKGNIFRGRTFRQAVMLDDAFVAYQMGPDEFEIYPRDGQWIDGTGNPYGPFTTSHIVFGKINLIAVVDQDLEVFVGYEANKDPIGPGVDTPAAPRAGVSIPRIYAGQRMAVRCVYADQPRRLRVWASEEEGSGFTIEDANASSQSFADFDVQVGTYIEWVLTTDATWQIVNLQQPGASGGGGGQMLPYVAGPPTPNSWVRASAAGNENGVPLPANAVDGDVVGVMVDAEGCGVTPPDGVQIQSVEPEDSVFGPESIFVQGFDYYEWIYLADRNLWQPRQTIRSWSDAAHGNRGGGSLHYEVDFENHGFISPYHFKSLYYRYKFDHNASRWFRSSGPVSYSAGFQPPKQTIEWVYVGRNTVGGLPIVTVSAFMLTPGTGTQDAQVVVGTSDNPPNLTTNAQITARAVWTNVDNMTAGGGKRGATDFGKPSIDEGMFVWLGIRCNFSGNNPTFAAVYDPANQVQIVRSLSVTAAPVVGTVYATEGVGYGTAPGSMPAQTVDLMCQINNFWP